MKILFLPSKNRSLAKDSAASSLTGRLQHAWIPSFLAYSLNFLSAENPGRPLCLKSLHCFQDGPLEIQRPAVFTQTVFLFPDYHSRQHSICWGPQTVCLVCCLGVMLRSRKRSLLPGTLTSPGLTVNELGLMPFLRCSETFKRSM